MSNKPSQTPCAKVGYCCGCLRSKQLTQDHIIPQSIGGKLTVPLCLDCHTNIYAIDAELAKHLHQFAALLNVKRERKGHKPFRVRQVSTGDEFDINSNSGRRARPIVNTIKFDNNGRPIPDVKARSKEELITILKGIERKYGEFAHEVELRTEPISLGMIEYENTIGGRLFMRSVAKSAYLLLASRVSDDKVASKSFDLIREFIFDDKGVSLTSFNFVHTQFMSKSRRPLHGIAIHFDSKKRNIIGYVQLFGIFRFSVLIAQSVPWAIDMADLKYCSNPVNGDEVPLKLLFTLPDIKSEDCLSPRQTIKFVHSEISAGLKKMRTYCNIMGKAEIEFSGQ
jgi:hypothetical protein